MSLRVYLDSHRAECERATSRGPCGDPPTHTLIRAIRLYPGGPIHGASESACLRHCQASADYLDVRRVPVWSIVPNPLVSK